MPNLLDDEKDFFVKESNGECASYVKKFRNIDDFQNNHENIPPVCIIQRKVDQHKKLSRLNPCAINTLRIVTICKGGNSFLFSCLLRVGTKETGNVDNWAAGGYAINVKNDGCLAEFGFQKPIYGKRSSTHPDTKVKFAEFAVPYYKEAIELCLKAHKNLFNIHSIGWDVCITQDGPCFIEGNDNWEISLHQGCCGPLKAE